VNQLVVGREPYKKRKACLECRKFQKLLFCEIVCEFNGYIGTRESKGRHFCVDRGARGEMEVF
jgi:hypothetical protein